MVSRHLESLDRELRLPPRARRRIVAEARDHLHQAVAAGLERGLSPEDAERAAVAGFGDPRELAAAFHEQSAVASASRASSRTSALLGVFLVAGLFAGGGRLNHFPYGVVVWIAAQVAVVSGAIAAARWLRYRGATGSAIPAARLGDSYRANVLTIACVAVAALAEGVDALTHGSSWPAGYAIGSAVLLAGAAAVGLLVARAGARARLVTLAEPPQPEGALDDLLAVSRMALTAAERRVPAISASRRRAEHAVAAVRGRAPRLALWLDLRRSPWRFCAIFALACGLALAAAHGITDGGGPLTLSNAARALSGGLVLMAIEGTAVVLGFAAFGRFLGIRR
jgi:HAAS domain-containing protein